MPIYVKIGSQKEIKNMLLVYSKDDCSRCQTLEMQLKQKQIPYSKKVLDKDYTRDDLMQIIPPSVKKFPFVFDSNGLVYMDDAAVQEYTKGF